MYAWQQEAFFIPLNWKYTLAEWQYVLEDVCPDFIIAVRVNGNEEYEKKLHALKEEYGDCLVFEDEICEMGQIEQDLESHALTPTLSPQKDLNMSNNALMIYTSGTTSKPKGVVLTFANVLAQIETMIKPWEWSENDCLLHVLPMHHTHGIINGLGCALYSGAAVQFMHFSEKSVWNTFGNGKVTMFFAVPTIFTKLIHYYDSLNDKKEKEVLRKSCSNLRLMVSGSAALPPPVLEYWKRITGHTLLERYGMTEIGMCLTNPLHPESARRAGFVGKPFPGVEVKLKDQESDQDVPLLEGESAKGELLVKGANVFKEYWNKPEATKKEFVNGWFKTGDAVEYSEGYFRILGRQSVDIIKTGGYKVSALEIEASLLQHERVKECAVLGLPDKEWGEIILAIIVPKHASAASPPETVPHSETAHTLADQLTAHCRKMLSNSKIPRKYHFVSHIPRNAMGKINKKSLLPFYRLTNSSNMQ